METTTDTLYSFKELSDEAKQKALDSMRERIASWDIEDNFRDFEGCFERFKQITGVTINWELWQNRVWLSADYYHSYWHEPLLAYTGYGFYTPDIKLNTLKGKLLQRWIRDFIEIEFIIPKTYHNFSRKIERVSKVNFWKRDNIKPSGFWLDEELYEPFLYYLAHPDETTTFEDLLDEALSDLKRSINKVLDDCYSDVNIESQLIEGDCEFYEDGQVA